MLNDPSGLLQSAENTALPDTPKFLHEFVTWPETWTAKVATRTALESESGEDIIFDFLST